MRPLQQGARATTVIALVGVLGAATASAQEPRPRPERLGDSIERTIEAFARVVEHNAEKWARVVEKNAERWAEDFERNAERWAEEIERHAESVAVLVEVEAAEQSEAARERAREARERAREQREEALERAREQREEAQERAREQREQAQERAREQRERERQGRGCEQTEQVSRTVRLGRTGIVDIDALSGDVTVTGGNGNDVRVEATKRVRGQDCEQGKAMLPDLRVDVTEGPGRVAVRTSYPRTRNFNGDVNFIVTVPSGADVFVKTLSGDVRATNIRGELRAETTSGDVTVTDASRVQLAKTMSGDLQITDAAGEITGGTMSGDVIVRNVRGRSLNVSTVSGDLVLTDIDVERADVGSTNGSIDFTGRLQKGGRYELRTHSGDVRLTPTSAQGFDVEARTLNGDIVSQYQMKLTPGSGAGERRGPSRSIRGTFGDAGAFISLQSFNGDITIVRK
jgi:DUF4097 and DUF4098 domain-containing protein YvlB